MRVAILGCGAMGTVMGAYMWQNGLEVELIDNYAAHVEAMNKHGARVVGAVDMTVPVKAVTPEQMTGVYDIVLLLTKQNANNAVLPNLLRYLGPDSIVCTLQNGVPEPSVAKHVGKERTVGGTVLWGATFTEPGVSELTQDLSKSNHLFEIGELDGTIGPRIQKVADVLDRMGIGGGTKITDTLMASRWGKLINNACMSGMSAACGATFGEVMDHSAARACLSYLGREVKQCCEASGYKLPILLHGHTADSFNLKDQAMFETNQALFLDMYRNMRTAKASMLQDLEKGKPTEVPMINGFVCDTGRQHGIATPFNDKVLEIVTKIEQGQLPLSMDNIELFDKSMFQYRVSET
jgi:2-dehydropantoate 2-reductase